MLIYAMELNDLKKIFTELTATPHTVGILFTCSVGAFSSASDKPQNIADVGDLGSTYYEDRNKFLKNREKDPSMRTGSIDTPYKIAGVRG